MVMVRVLSRRVNEKGAEQMVSSDNDDVDDNEGGVDDEGRCRWR